MAIKFKHDLAALLSDLEMCGYVVNVVRQSPGKSVEVELFNGVTVTWDRYCELIWSSGPYRPCRRLDRRLARLYIWPQPLSWMCRAALVQKQKMMRRVFARPLRRGLETAISKPSTGAVYVTSQPSAN